MPFIACSQVRHQPTGTTWIRSASREGTPAGTGMSGGGAETAGAGAGRAIAGRKGASTGMGTSVAQGGERMRDEPGLVLAAPARPGGMPGEGIAEMIIDLGNEIVQETEQMIRIRRRQEGQEHGAGAISRHEITTHARARQQAAQVEQIIDGKIRKNPVRRHRREDMRAHSVSPDKM